jgi:hypothetical protein
VVKENAGGRREPTIGCTKPANRWKLCDLTGNATEWTRGGGLRGGGVTTKAADSTIDILDRTADPAFARPFVGFRVILMGALDGAP